MLSQLCLPKSTSSVPSTSGGLRAPVTNALKHRENKYKTHQPAREAAESIGGVSLSTSSQEKQVEGASRWDQCVC